MPYSQSLDLCFEASIGAGGLAGAQYDAALDAAAKGVSSLRRAFEKGELAFLNLPARRDDLEGLRTAAAKFARGASDIVVLATGGSSLGGQAVVQLTGWQTPGVVTSAQTGMPRLHFMDNLDPVSLDAAFAGLDLKATRFLVISKSGKTAETVMQMIAAIEALNAQGLDWNIAGHFLAISAPEGANGDNALRRLCALHDIPVLDHDRDIGGRFSVLSAVGMVPALLAGVDAQALREGAAQVLDTVLNAPDMAAIPPAAGAAATIAMARHRGASVSVMMAYADRLACFTGWHAQLWAESLGKEGKGTTPLRALGPVDQHSQLQLFLDGPPDKLFTIITCDVARLGPVVPISFSGDPLVGYLAGKSVGDLVDCAQRATIQTLADRGRAVRVINIDALNERTLGALFMHFMLETVIAGHMLGVSVFDQPAVEEGKRLARDCLAGGLEK